MIEMEGGATGRDSTAQAGARLSFVRLVQSGARRHGNAGIDGNPRKDLTEFEWVRCAGRSGGGMANLAMVIGHWHMRGYGPWMVVGEGQWRDTWSGRSLERRGRSGCGELGRMMRRFGLGARLCDRGRTEHAGLGVGGSIIRAENAPSIRIAEKLGEQLEAIETRDGTTVYTSGIHRSSVSASGESRLRDGRPRRNADRLVTSDPTLGLLQRGAGGDVRSWVAPQQ